jgi:nitrate reductase NapE component
MSDSQKLPVDRVSTTFFQTVRAVAWSFLGVRKKSELDADMARLNIFHILAVGFVGAILFVLTLIALVHWIVAK